MRSPAAAGRDDALHLSLDKLLQIQYEKAMTRNESGETPAKASWGWCKPGGRKAAQPSDKPPVKNRPYACVKGERGRAFGRVNRSGTANRVCSSPGRQAFFIYLKKEYL